MMRALLLAHLAAAFHIDLDTNLIVDELGRARVFHGVNAVEKLGSFKADTLSAAEIGKNQARAVELLNAAGWN